MLSNFNRFLQSKASGRNVLLLLAVTIVSFSLMAFVLTPAFQDATGGLRPFDLNTSITPDIMYEELPSYTAKSRGFYLVFAFLDYVYPAAASTFFALLWVWIFSKAPNRVYDGLMRAGVLLLPFIFALVDWLENAGFLIVIFGYPAEFPTIAGMAATLKGIKGSTGMPVLALTVIFAVATVSLRLVRRAKGHRESV